MRGASARKSLRADDLDDPAPVALSVQLEEQHALPGAEAELAVAYLYDDERRLTGRTICCQNRPERALRVTPCVSS